MVSFRVCGARIAEVLLPKLKLFTLAKSLGGVESLSELLVRMTHASIPPTEHEGLGVEKIELMEDLRGALDGLEDEVSGLVTP
jgi:cystathionine beta-lyase/cystathionine gamma-synthase